MIWGLQQVELFTVVIVAMIIYSYMLAVISSLPLRTDLDGDCPKYFFVLIVPMLNEEQVISNTLSSLLGLSGDFLVLLIDDASDDATVATVTRFLHDPRVRLLQRPPSEARLGKGAALNAGFTEIQRLGLVERYGSDNLIVVVFDADGRVHPRFLEAVARYFYDPELLESSLRSACTTPAKTC